MWHSFKKHNGEVVVTGSLKLKAKNISCSGWVVRKDMDICSREIMG